jgi:hypothetical protein
MTTADQRLDDMLRYIAIGDGKTLIARLCAPLHSDIRDAAQYTVGATALLNCLIEAGPDGHPTDVDHRHAIMATCLRLVPTLIAMTLEGREPISIGASVLNQGNRALRQFNAVWVQQDRGLTDFKINEDIDLAACRAARRAATKALRKQ